MPTRNLHYYSGNNYQKQYLVDSQQVTVPPTIFPNTVEVLALPIDLDYVPTARVFMEFGGRKAPNSIPGCDVQISAFITDDRVLKVHASNFGFGDITITVHYRIYLDA